MSVKIEFETDNAAFEEFREAEIKRILHEIAARQERNDALKEQYTRMIAYNARHFRQGD